MARPPRLADVRVAAIDGPSGSGKSTFAARLAEQCARSGTDVAVVHTDDLLDGWGHPSNFGPYLRQWILNPLAAGGEARYRAYDWNLDKFGPDWRRIPRPDLLIVEGVTTAAAAWRPVLSYSVLMTADSELCLARGIDRDGERVRGALEIWRGHEAAHYAADRTEAHVDTIVDSDSALPHDERTQFVEVTTATG